MFSREPFLIELNLLLTSLINNLTDLLMLALIG